MRTEEKKRSIKLAANCFLPNDIKEKFSNYKRNKCIEFNMKNYVGIAYQVEIQTK